MAIFLNFMPMGGRYRFTPRQYIAWLLKWRPRWAATMDLCCVGLDAKGAWQYPGKQEVERRQRYTTEKAAHFWAVYQPVPFALCPTIQGYHPEEYVRHAQILAPLLREMHETYLDTGWTDEEQEQQESAFRVGIGSLCGRDPLQVHEIIGAVRAVIGDLPLHLWGTKGRFLRSSLASDTVVSMDTAAWNGLWGPEHEARRQSGLSEAAYCWDVCYPRYDERIRAALQKPKFSPMIEISPVPLSLLEEAKSSQIPLPHCLRYRWSGEGPGEQQELLRFDETTAVTVKPLCDEIQSRP